MDRVLAEQLLDAQELVVPGHTVGVAERSGLDLAAVGCRGDIGMGRVFLSARTVPVTPPVFDLASTSLRLTSPI